MHSQFSTLLITNCIFSNPSHKLYPPGTKFATSLTASSTFMPQRKEIHGLRHSAISPLSRACHLHPLCSPTFNLPRPYFSHCLHLVVAASRKSGIETVIIPAFKKCYRLHDCTTARIEHLDSSERGRVILFLQRSIKSRDTPTGEVRDITKTTPIIFRTARRSLAGASGVK